MNPEKLALMAAKSLDMLGIGGGYARLTSQDIAGAMHKLSENEYELLTVKYVGDHPRKLMRIVEARIKRKTSIPAGNREQIAIQAILEAVGPNTCPECKGTKEYSDNGVGICKLCDGIGHFYQDAGMYQRELDQTVAWLQRVESAGMSKIEGVYDE